MANDGAVFFDVLPRLDLAAVTTVSKTVSNIFSQMGKDVSAAVGASAREIAVNDAITQVNKMAAAKEATAKKVQSASNATVLATEREAAAQAKLNETVDKYGADSARALKAKADLTAASQAAATATTAEAAAKDKAIAAEGRHAEAVAASTAASAKASTTMADYGKVANTVGVAAFVGLGAAIAGTTKSAVDFQQQQTRLVASAGEDAKNLAMVGQGVLDMSTKVGYSTTQLNDALYQINSSGHRGADGLKVLQAAAQGAKAENADLSEVVNGLTSSMTDFGYGPEKAAEVMSKMVVATGNAKVTFQQFSGALHSVEPVAQAAGLKLEDVYATLAQMTQSGMSADQATQNMKHAILQLQKPTGDMSSEMAQLGLNSNQVAQSLGSKGLAGTMQEISDAIISHYNPAQQVQIRAGIQNEATIASQKALYQQMTPELKKAADAFDSGALSATQWRKTAGGVSAEAKNQITAYVALHDKADSFTKILSQGKGEYQTYSQAMQKATGDQTSAQVALMVTGEHAKSTNDLIAQLSKTTADHSGKVKGFEEVEKTAALQSANFHNSIHVLAVEMGTTFLPYVTKATEEAAKLLGTLGQHPAVLKAIIIGLTAIAGTWATVKLGKLAWDGVNGAIKGARATLNFFMGDAENPGLWTRIKSGASSAFDAVKNAAAATGRGIKAAWNVAGDAASWIVMKARAIGSFVATTASAGVEAGKSAGAWLVAQARAGAGWVATQVKTVGSFVATTASAVVESAATATAWVVQSGKAAASWVAMKGKAVAAFVATTASALTESALVAGAWIVQNTKAAASFVLVEGAMIAQAAASKAVTAAQWLMNAAMDANPIGIVITLIAGLAAGLVYAYKHSQTFRDIVQGAMKIVGDSATWLWEKAFKPALDALGKGWNWLYDDVIKPVGSHMESFFKGMKDGIDTTVDFFHKGWSKIKGFAMEPVKFVLETVYNKGIAPMWNDIAGIFGGSKLPILSVSGIDSAISAFAGGGIVKDGTGVLVPEAARALGIRPSIPGYAPGVDDVAMQTSSGKRAVFSKGEAFVDPQMFGGPAGLWAVNHHYSGGRENANGTKPGTHFAPGGIVGDIIGGAENAVKGAVEKAKLLAKFASDPIKAAKDYFAKWVEKIVPGNAGAFRVALQSAPGKTVDAIANWVKSWFGNHPGAGSSGGNERWASGAGAQQWDSVIRQALQLEGFPTDDAYVRATEAQIMTESGGNPNIVQGIQDVNSGGNEAQGLVQVTPRTAAGLGLAGLGGNIYDPLTNLRLGMRELKSQHGGDLLGTWGHGHGYAGGGIVPGATKSLADLKAYASSFEGHPYVWGGEDCSGVQSKVVNFLTGSTGRFATPTEGSALTADGFREGDPPAGTAAYWIGWLNGGPGGGHTAGTIVDPAGGSVNLEMGGQRGNGQYGGSAAGAKDFPNRMWIPLQGEDTSATGGSGGASGGSSGGSSGGGSSSGGSSGGGSSSGGTDALGNGIPNMGDPSNWSLKGLATYASSMAANALLGNPVGRLKALQGGGSSGTGTIGAGSGAEGATALSGGGITATPTSTTAATGQQKSAVEKAQDALKLAEAQKSLSSATESVTKAQTSLNKATTKYAEGSPQVASAHLTLTRAQERQKAATDAVAKAQADLNRAGPKTATDKANDTVTANKAAANKAQDALTNAQSALQIAIQRHGADSKEAAKAKAAVATAQDKATAAQTVAGASAPSTTPDAATGTSGGGSTAPADGDRTPDLTTAPGTQSAGASATANAGGAGFGIGGGGLIGAATSVAGGAASGGGVGAATGGAGAAADVGLQIANRAVSYAGQVGGILADGLLETFGLSDPMTNTLPGKLFTGLAGAHPVSPNSAGTGGSNGKPVPAVTTGQAQAGIASMPGQQQGKPAPVVNIEKQEVHNGDGAATGREIVRQVNGKVGGGAR